jgi:hypothetical protein
MVGRIVLGMDEVLRLETLAELRRSGFPPLLISRGCNTEVSSEIGIADRLAKIFGLGATNFVLV